MTNLTFGKWEGWNTEDMAKTLVGREYLQWGSKNLKNQNLQSEFKKALKISGIDKGLAIKAEMFANQLTRDEAEKFVNEHLGEKDQDELFFDLKDRFGKYLSNNGVSTVGINLILSFYSVQELEDAEKDGKVQFSGSKKKATILKGMTHYGKELAKIY